MMHANIPLSKLVSHRKNPRRVKPEREGHKRLVASIRAFDLLEPLVVRPLDDDGTYQVIAGQRRLAALREVHRGGEEDPKIACQVRKVDDPTAAAMSLSEKFAREAMHPLDEAEAFAKLASLEAKGAEVIAIEFGVTAHYVRQRMKLATLANDIKATYRAGGINTSIAEAFTAVPRERQEQIWKELNGQPRHAEQIRRVIASSWIDASHALFDVSVLPDLAVSRDLFNEQVLVERTVFLEEQTKALEAQRAAMIEEGWSQAIIARREDVQDKLFSMNTPDREFDAKTSRRLAKAQEIREKLEGKADETDDQDVEAVARLQEKFDALETRERAIVEQAPEHFSEATKAIATAFLLLDPDGTVRREYRVPRSAKQSINHDATNTGGVEPPARDAPLTSENLSDRQLATTFHHHALAVRAALLDNSAARKRVLALLLHEKVRSEAIALRHDANGTTLHANGTEGFASPALEKLREKRAAADPFMDAFHVDDVAAYKKLSELSDSQMNALIAVLTIESLTAHPLRRTELLQELASELKVDLRATWSPDAAWLSSYQKIQLAHLMGELRGPLYRPADERRKKSEMVDSIAALFSNGAEGKIEDKQLAERVHAWLPANIGRASPSPH